MSRRTCAACLAFLLVSAWSPAREPLADYEKAQLAAIAKVAPCVVQIETTGGTEVIGAGPGGTIRKGVGPTTGVIVAADGFIISSAFNFANKPAAIFVTIPGRKERFVAKVVASDQARYLTLLKIDATELPVPTPAPTSEFAVGQWTLALGRTFENNLERPPSVSVGILSAVGRVWGRAFQVDAKVSPVNYGGPVVDLQGRVMGILVPASPNGEGETVGVEWYDSGIGFAIPLENINRVLPKLRSGQDLKRGLLGISPRSNDLYSVVPTVGTVAPGSVAEQAGIKPGDIVVEVDGKSVVNQAQVLHALGPKYESDTVTLKVKRGADEQTFTNLVLAGSTAAYVHPFIGILPGRDDPGLGVPVRWVYPKSPAEAAGIKVGDRIMKIAPESAKDLTAFSGRGELTDLLNRLAAGSPVKLELKRGDKTENLTIKLAALPDSVPEQIPAGGSAKQALMPQMPANPMPKKEAAEPAEPKKEQKPAETGLLQRVNVALGQEYWVYVPPNYDPNIRHALVLWLHPAGKAKEANDFIDIWKEACAERHLIIVGPRTANSTGWVASETDFILAALKDVTEQYTIDRQRIVAHGMANGGQMATYLGFRAREVIRGVATTGAALTSAPKENVPNARLSFYIVGGGKDPLVKEIAGAKPQLQERKFPVIYREIATMGKEYLDLPTFQELIRWIDTLDQL